MLSNNELVAVNAFLGIVATVQMQTKDNVAALVDEPLANRTPKIQYLAWYHWRWF